MALRCLLHWSILIPETFHTLDVFSGALNSYIHSQEKCFEDPRNLLRFFFEFCSDSWKSEILFFSSPFVTRPNWNYTSEEITTNWLGYVSSLNWRGRNGFIGDLFTLNVLTLLLLQAFHIISMHIFSQEVFFLPIMKDKRHLQYRTAKDVCTCTRKLLHLPCFQ